MLHYANPDSPNHWLHPQTLPIQCWQYTNTTTVEEGEGPQTILRFYHVCPSAGVTMLMKWKTYSSKLFVYDKIYALILLIRDPSLLCLAHSQDKVSQIFSHFTYQNWTVGEPGNEATRLLTVMLTIKTAQ